MFSAVFVFQVFWLLKVLKKIRKNYIENQRDGSFQSSQERPPGATTRDQEGPWCGPTLGRARRPPGFLVRPFDAPLRLYLPLGSETPKTEPFLSKPSLFRRRRHFKIGAA